MTTATEIVSLIKEILKNSKHPCVMITFVDSAIRPEIITDKTIIDESSLNGFIHIVTGYDEDKHLLINSIIEIKGFTPKEEDFFLEEDDENVDIISSGDLYIDDDNDDDDEIVDNDDSEEIYAEEPYEE